MQVSVESTGNLERKMTVQVPAEQIENEVTKRLQSLAREVKLDGFRPGKVPFKVVKKRFDSRVREEVMNEVMQRTFYEALTEQKINPAGGPHIEPTNIKAGEALEYIATFEVYPEIELADLSDVTIEQPVVEVADADMDKMLEKLQVQRTSFKEVDRPAQETDQVIINFEGSIDGEAFAGNKAEDTPLVLGSGQMIPGFEDQLIGASAGEHRTLDISFPEDYHGKEVAGKQAVFEVDVNKVNEAELPEMNDEFARVFGADSLDALREEVRANMQRETKQRAREQVKKQVLDALVEKNEIDLPNALVDHEIDNMVKQSMQNQPEAMQNMKLPREIFESQARRRVSLGLLMGEVAKQNNIEVDPDKVSSLIDEIAATYDQPEEVKRAYHTRQDLRSNIEGLALEEQVVDHVLSIMKTEEKAVSFEELGNQAG